MLHLFSKKKVGAKFGFTLIELLVVIAIIGVLASIVLASLNTARAKSRDAKRVADLRQVQLALELYFDAQSPAQYPAAAAGSALPAGLATGGFIPQIPVAPGGAGTPCANYCYAAPGLTPTVFHLGVTVEGTVPGNDKNCNSSIAALTNCSTGGATAAFTGGFDGTTTNPKLYDVQP